MKKTLLVFSGISCLVAGTLEAREKPSCEIKPVCSVYEFYPQYGAGSMFCKHVAVKLNESGEKEVLLDDFARYGLRIRFDNSLYLYVGRDEANSKAAKVANALKRNELCSSVQIQAQDELPSMVEPSGEHAIQDIDRSQSEGSFPIESLGGSIIVENTISNSIENYRFEEGFGEHFATMVNNIDRVDFFSESIEGEKVIRTDRLESLQAR